VGLAPTGKAPPVTAHVESGLLHLQRFVQLLTSAEVRTFSQQLSAGRDDLLTIMSVPNDTVAP